jgi:hypothetical protein
VVFPSFDRDDWLESARDVRDGFSFVTYLRARPAGQHLPERESRSQSVHPGPDRPPTA